MSGTRQSCHNPDAGEVKAINHIVVSDIFGRTEALERFGAELGSGTQIVDPYNGRNLAFTDESCAYQYFISEVGLPRYAQILQSALSANNTASRLIGFSVGAAAIWLNSERLSDTGIQQAVCFYASQIRHTTDIQPDIDLTLIMPGSEPHFSVSDLAEQLRHKPRVKIRYSCYLHGFMNRCSANFSQAGYQHYLVWIKQQTNP